VDARKVKQIVYNLLSNAVKFTLEGGNVTLRARRVTSAQVLRPPSGGWAWRGDRPSSESEVTTFLEISVTDSGIGIGSEDLDRLFKPFSQIDSGLARRFEGTGLGLALVKLLAELHGGAVFVESAIGEGSRFTVWLPVREWDVPRERRTSLTMETAWAAQEQLPLGAPTALVVEDDIKSSELIRVQLEAAGFHVLSAASAEQGLVIAKQQPLALITLDIMLPDMDGWEFLGRVRQIPALARVPVVIISIVADSSKGFALGASAIMLKPFSRQELYEALVEIGLFPIARGKSPKVLVADDDPRALELTALRIGDMGSTVVRASGGQEAIDLARKELPDLIVLDLMMPDVNGFDVVDVLQQRPETARIPIMVVTAKQLTPEERKKLNGFVKNIVEKGELDAERFTSEVRRAMSGRQLVV
jgi:CheY-like chemotaxis protein